jgi:hypothetical protein
VLGVRAVLGRTFTEAETEGRAAAAVVSHAFWRTRLRADPGVVGRTMKVNGQGVPIVGVAPPTFASAFSGFAIDFWMTAPAYAAITPGWERPDDSSSRFLMLVGRLADGVSRLRAEAALGLRAAQLSMPAREERCPMR